MKDTKLIRIHLPRAVVQRLDQIAAAVRSTLGRRVGRAAIVRALVYLHVDTLTPDLAKVVASDPVKRGRPTERGQA